MQFKNTKTSYGLVNILLHWLMAFGYIALLAVGFIMTDMEDSDSKWQVYMLHKSFGFTILVFALFRLVWKLSGPVPTIDFFTKKYEVIAYKIGHFFLYFAMIGIPFSGWLMSSAADKSINYFNIATIPNITSPNENLAKLAREAHEIIAYFLIILIIGHVLVALYHHLIKKDNTIYRMLKPGFKI